MDDRRKFEASRRRVIATAGTAGALVAAAAALPLAREAEASAADANASPPERGGGYRVTPHVLRYYQTTRV